MARKKKPRVKNDLHAAYGSEPSYDEGYLIDGVELTRWFNWHNYCSTTDKAVKWVKELFKDHPDIQSSNIDKAECQSDFRTPGWICRALLLGYKLDQNIIDRMTHKVLMKAANIKTKPRHSKKEPVKVDIQARTRERVSEIIGDVEALIDQGAMPSIFDWMSGKELPGMYGKEIADYYRPIRDEMEVVASGKDASLQEGYTHLSDAEKTQLWQMYVSIVSEAERYADTEKVKRKVRKTTKKAKPRDYEKIFKNFKYRQRDPELNLTSISPQSIIEAQEVWLYDTKYNQARKLIANGSKGLYVEGTTIKGFDKDKSFKLAVGKKKGRDDLLKAILKNGNPIKRIMSNFKQLEANGRCNENTIVMWRK